MSDSTELLEVLREVKRLARRYYDLTGRPLGITGEVAELEAIEALGLDPAPVRQPGFDAARRTAAGIQRLQIKGRLVSSSSKPGQRVGGIDLGKRWDAILLVLLDEDFDPTAIYEADRSAVTEALAAPGSKARNERGQLSIGKFKSIGRQVWPNQQ